MNKLSTPETVVVEKPEPQIPDEEVQTVEIRATPEVKAFTIKSIDYHHLKFLKKVLKVAEALKIDELTFTYDRNQKTLHLRQMDASRVAMIDATTTFGKALDEATQPDENPSVFTVELRFLKRALNLTDPTIEVSEKMFVSGKLSSTYKTSKVSIPLLDETPENVPTPKVEWNIHVEMNVKNLTDGIHKIVPDVEYLIFTSKNQKLEVTASSDLQHIEVPEAYSCKGADGSATFSIDLLKTLGSGEWKLSFSENMPMKAVQTETATDYTGDGPPRKIPLGNITVYIAPRIEVE